MKKSIYLSGVLLLGLLTSCGGGNTKPKEIQPTSTEFTSGELAKYIEIDSEATELTYAEVDGAIPTQYIRLNVPVTLVKEGFKDVDPRDISFTSLIAVAIVDLQDENGSKVQSLDLKSEDFLKLKKLLTQDEGATETLVFEGKFHNDKEAPKWFESAASYTPTLTANIYIENSNEGNGISVGVTVDDDDSYSESSSTSDEDFDEFLAAYEKYIDEYIALMKKAKDGDYSAMADAASLMSDAQEYGEKLQKISGSLTAAQLAKFQKLQEKLLKAAQ